MNNRRRTQTRKRELLISSNQSTRRVRRFRNPFLNSIVKFFWIKRLVKFCSRSLILSVVLFLMLGFVVFATASPYFNIKKIDVVRDNPNISPAAIEAVLTDFYEKNMLFLRDADVRSRLHAEFPEFREISVNEKWPSTIELKIQVSPPMFTLFNTETANFSTVSEDGVILAESLGENLSVVKVFQHPEPLLERQEFINANSLQKILDAQKMLLRELGLPISEVRILSRANELHLVTRGEVAIWIDLSLPIEPQIQKLVLAENEIDLGSNSLEHIDLRIPKQIFWK
jgi:cell division septal protein FtsQ